MTESTSGKQEKRPPSSRRFFRRVNSLLLQWDTLYRLRLKLHYGWATPALTGDIVPPNRTLKTRSEWNEALENGRTRHLPLHRSPEKNWDHLMAVAHILAKTTTDARVLDAGAELYSNVLPTLFLCGYRDLYGINLSFADPARRGPIRYNRGDLTRTGFPDAFFDAITCMSVLEHGVPLEPYFKEMYRLLRPGGTLITSVDYYPTSVDTRGLEAYGSPIKVFSKPEIKDALSLAQLAGLQLTGDVDLECNEKPICWEPYGLEYTFLIFTLQKPK